MIQVLFLGSVLGGVTSLVGAIGVARLRWRSDVTPFGRQTNSFKVLALPALYVVESVFPLFERWLSLGAVLSGPGLFAWSTRFWQNLADRDNETPAHEIRMPTARPAAGHQDDAAQPCHAPDRQETAPASRWWPRWPEKERWK